ncbi:MAG TPA: hypothetical protein VE007_07425, partial [Thermoanaerobaculia bacterium]|nr:hypothetical protein [Thermoanaerobaculia bacterium]
MPNSRVGSLATALAALLLPAALLAQKDERAQTVRLDEGITVQVAPLWRSRPLPPSGPTKLELTVADGPLLRMAVYFTVEKRRDAADALQRVAEISGPPAEKDRRFLVNGWPAVEATRTIDVPQTSQEKEKQEAEAGREPHDIAVAKFERTMTAIAAGDRAVIIEQRLYDTADTRLREAGRAVVDGLTFTRGGDEAIGKRALDDIDFVRKNLYDQRSGLVSSVSDRYPFFTEVTKGPPILAQTGVGEIAMAASYSGVKVAIATNSGWARSADSGATYNGGNNFPATIANQGDPALAYGGKADNFYLGYLGLPNGSGAAGSANAANGCSVSVDRS